VAFQLQPNGLPHGKQKVNKGANGMLPYGGVFRPTLIDFYNYLFANNAEFRHQLLVDGTLKDHDYFTIKTDDLDDPEKERIFTLDPDKIAVKKLSDKQLNNMDKTQGMLPQTFYITLFVGYGADGQRKKESGTSGQW
jgi:hypothetical protein